jgi:hypothetical protein
MIGFASYEQFRGRSLKNPLICAAMLGAVLFVIPRTLYADPPARVARASYVAGQVSIRHGTASDWMAFVLNFPVTTGDEIWVDTGARTELHIGSTALRLSERTALEMVLIEDDRVVLSLTQGTLNLRVRTLDSGDRLQIETPSSTISISQPGTYSVTVDSLGNATAVVVRLGVAEIANGGGSYDLDAGQSAFVTGDPSPNYDLRGLPGEDEFDAWSADRDRGEDQSEAAQYVSRDMTGYESLDGHGRWENTPDYGPVWAPSSVGPGWAPYQTGRWVWVDPWGWTWMDEQPWGFAPFHYGRWAQYNGAWVWAPGERVARPVYGPAMVGFVGGSGWSTQARFGAGGGVAWFPLAPGEPWVPSYHVSDAYARNVNVTYVHVTNIVVVRGNVSDIHYRNMQVEGAVTAVPRETFVSARPVHPAAVPFGAKEVAQAEVVGHAGPVTPQHDSKIVAAPSGRAPAVPPPRVAVRVDQTRMPPVAKAAPTPAPAPAPIVRPESYVKPKPGVPAVENAAQVPPPARPAPPRVPTSARPETAALAKQRALEQQQLLEHTQLQDKQLQEKAAPPAGVTPAALQQKQANEKQAMETRHASESATVHAAPVPPKPPSSKSKQASSPKPPTPPKQPAAGATRPPVPPVQQPAGKPKDEGQPPSR